jgi:hypothetical protein
MTREQWIAAYIAEFAECCDCNVYVAQEAGFEAARLQWRRFGDKVSLWDDPQGAVQTELASWEPA